MTDYSKLIKKLRGKHKAYVATGNAKSAEIFSEAADAIEDLMLEVEALEASEDFATDVIKMLGGEK